MSAFVCPCLFCPSCYWVKDADDCAHPEDGLASCPNCPYEWWAHLGPRATRGRHLSSPEQLAEWKAYDDEVHRTGVEPELRA